MTTNHVLNPPDVLAADPLQAIGRDHRSPEIQPDQTTLVMARSISRIWGRGDSPQIAVDNVDLDIRSGEFVAVVGPSGSGKSTLGSLIAGLDRPTAGSIVIEGTRLDDLGEDALARWRANNVGIVFQNFHLIPTLTAAENVALGLRFGSGVGQRRQRRRLATEALATVGLDAKSGRLPSQLSGGEQQRVGIARAIVHQPRLIVADEPTGSLDTASGQQVVELISRLRDGGTTIVFITHDSQFAAEADRTVTMVDGRIARAER
ncbi:MAG: ABC transporter ATP-binding protein [Acidimicrobiales bacterium]